MTLIVDVSQNNNAQTSGIRTQGLLYRLVLDEKMKRLKELIIDLAPPAFCDEREASCSQLDKHDFELMNQDQKKVMQRLEQTEDYLLIHGMPGTGKTTTIALLVCAFCFRPSEPPKLTSHLAFFFPNVHNRFKHLLAMDKASW